MSYSNTFSGMLQWEPLMPRDLSELFPPYSTPIVTASSTLATATSTPTTATSTSSVPVVIASFHDEVVNNHDVRVYLDAANRTIFLYGYWNQVTLVIARNTTAFTEILDRLAAARSQ